MQKFKVLTYTTLFPNNINNTFAVFVRERIKYMTQIMNLKVVVAPVPYFPPLKINKKWYAYSQVKKLEKRNDIILLHPRFFTIPKLFMSLYGYFLYYSTIGTVSRIKRLHGFDIIDSHYAYPDGFAAALIGKKLGVPVTITVRGTDINLFPTFPRVRKKIIYALNHANKIISVSQALKDKIVNMGIPEHKIEVIRNGVDTNNFNPISYKHLKSVYPMNDIRGELDLPSDRKIILSIGNLVDTKGFQLLIKALNIIKCREDKNTPLLVIVGKGPYRSTLENLVSSLDLKDDVKFTGPIQHESLNEWYNACNVFCLASFREGVPNVILESFACGRPVVATNVGGIPEVVTEDTGIIVDELSANKFAHAINQALIKEWDRKKIVDHAKTFNWNNTTEKINSIFQSLTKTNEKDNT